MGFLTDVWRMYTPAERKNIAIYIAGIMLYKFALESFNGSIQTLATDRFGDTRVFGRVGLLNGLNQAFQCVGSILIAPLIQRFPTRSVLSCAIIAFALLTTILLAVDAGTGGHFKTGAKPSYGNYPPDLIIAIHSLNGIAYGMVELIRRVIPRDIVGGHVGKLKRMDAVVHIMYEVAGTIGAFASAYFIGQWGNNYSFVITPPLFTLAGITWSFISVLQFQTKEERAREIEGEGGAVGLSDVDTGGYIGSALRGFRDFGRATYLGAKIVLSSRKFCWLVPGYTFALYGHRYLENGIANIFAKSVLQNSSYQQIIIGGSNLGELFGALTVFLAADKIHTPIPFIRADALLLLIVWVVPFYYVPAGDVSYAWRLAGIFIPISYGWAAGDVSLAAYIQSSLARVESRGSGVSALGAVMAFLYVTYIVIYAILSPVLGTYVDDVLASQPAGAKDAHPALLNIAGVQFTILAVIILAATFIPRGALSLNPTNLHNEDLNKDLDEEFAIEKKITGEAPDEHTDDSIGEKKSSTDLKPVPQEQ